MKKMSIKLKYNGVAVNVYVQGQIQVRSDTVEETMHTGEKKTTETRNSGVFWKV